MIPYARVDSTSGGSSTYFRDRAFAVGALRRVNGQLIGRSDTPARAAAYAAAMNEESRNRRPAAMSAGRAPTAYGRKLGNS